jgi:hypothetical protein
MRISEIDTVIPYDSHFSTMGFSVIGKDFDERILNRKRKAAKQGQHKKKSLIRDYRCCNK